MTLTTSLRTRPDVAQHFEAASRSPLAPKYVDALHGEWQLWNSPHAAMSSLALACANRPNAWHRLRFTTEAQQLAREVCRQDKKPTGKASYVAGRYWDRAVARVAEQPAARPDAFEVRAYVVELEQAANLSAWPGRAGTSDRLALAAVHSLAIERRTALLGLSCRDVGLRAGLGTGTAARALRRLEGAGWLVKAAPRLDPTHATTYRLTRPSDSDVMGHRVLPPTGEGTCPIVTTTVHVSLEQLASHDAFTHRALGRMASRVLPVLDDLQALTASEVASRLGVSRRSAFRALEALEAPGIVWRVRRGRAYEWTLRPASLDSLDEVAEAYGTTGTAARKAESVRLERQRYADHVADRDEHRRRVHAEGRASQRRKVAA